MFLRASLHKGSHPLCVLQVCLRQSGGITDDELLVVSEDAPQVLLLPPCRPRHPTQHDLGAFEEPTEGLFSGGLQGSGALGESACCVERCRFVPQQHEHLDALSCLPDEEAPEGLVLSPLVPKALASFEDNLRVHHHTADVHHVLCPVDGFPDVVVARGRDSEKGTRACRGLAWVCCPPLRLPVCPVSAISQRADLVLHLLLMLFVLPLLMHTSKDPGSVRGNRLGTVLRSQVGESQGLLGRSRCACRGGPG
mmetsp:Transcript_11771/g.22599  ORF Transcript_11771/g.22599 Transcript_11771/m.22599 type:complete len:252 (-) Transcript_11771:432-1187(-)